MSLGTAVFLVGVLFAIIYLYTQTKNSWDWKKGIKLIGKIFGGAACLVILGLCVAFLNSQYGSRLKIQTEYVGISLGMSKPEVLYKKGSPVSLLTDQAVGNGYFKIVAFNQMPHDKTVNDYDVWYYGGTNKYEDTITVGYNKFGKVYSVSCTSSGILGCLGMLGLGYSPTEEDMVNRLGVPEFEGIERTTGIKYVEYPKYGVKFQLKQGSIFKFEVYDPLEVQ